MTEENSKIKVAKDFRCGTVAILGRPNAGKSTLLNGLIDLRLSAVSKRPQTTRTNIRGVLQFHNTKETWNGQLVIIDTPGVNFKRGLLDRSMHANVEHALKDVDVAVWLADARTFKKDLREIELGRPGSDKLAGWLKHRLGNTEGLPWVLALSKVDLVAKNELLPLMARISELMPEFKGIVPIAAQLGTKNKDSNLENLVTLLRDLSPKGPPLFPEDSWTDLSDKAFIQNLIREAIFQQGREEVPYECDCSILRFIEPTGKKKLSEVDATIWVSRKSLKPIMVGKQGAMIRDIGTQVRERYKEVTGEDIILRLFVKVVEDWESAPQSLEDLGYVIS